ncbi:MAG TPA: nitroreductase [Chloroflexota bacterium]|nr:nitroreductase [Chloroflexota bacterium]
MATEVTATSQTGEERPLLDTLTAIRTRRAVKTYDPTPIPQEWIEELLDAARWAPNHHLTHPWRFNVFTGEGREKLVPARQAAVRLAAERKGEPVKDEELEFARAKCYSAPVLLIVSQVINPDPIKDKEDWAACWCAIENFLLAATARGLASYPSTGVWVDENTLGPAIGLPENERPVACVFLGYSDAEIPGKRFPAERHTRWFTEA